MEENGDRIFVNQKIYDSSINILIIKADMIHQVMQQSITKMKSWNGTAKYKNPTNIIEKEGKMNQCQVLKSDDQAKHKF